MGPADSARAEDDARLQLAATNPSPPPPERKSPSPPSNSPTPSPSPSPGSGSGSGTTQSASVEDQTPPLAPTEKGRDPGASLSQPQDPDSWQGLIDAVSKGRPVKRPVKPVKWPAGSHQPCASEILADGDIALRRQDGRSHSTGRKQGLALSSGCPAPGLPSALLTSTSKKKESLGRGKGDAGIPNGVGDQELRHSPPGSPPAVKLEFEQDSWQQAQHASRAFVKFEPGGYDIQGGVVEEEAGLRRQGHWQAAWETPQAQHAQHVAQPRDSKLKWTPELHSRFVRCVGQLGGLQKAKPKKILKMMSDGNQGLTKERIKNYLQRFKQSLRLPEVQSGEVSPAVSDAERQTCAQPLPTDSGFPPSQAPFPPSQTDLARPNTSHGFTFPSQPPPHEPLLSVADAEAQLFFMSPSPAMLPTAGMGAPVPNGFPPDSGPLPPLPPHCRSLQNQPLHAQHHLYCQQQRQQQWLTLQHQQHLMLERRQQHHHQHLMGFSSKQQQSVQASKASQGLRVPHPQKQPPLTRTNSAQHAMPAEPSQPPASVPSSLNGLSGAPQDSSRTQHAKHGANGYSKHQQGANGDSKPLQGARGTSPHQKAQHAQHGTNGVLNPSGQSMQSGQLNSRSGSGVSTAFILWVDGQYKSKGQVEKRAALRSFVQSAKVSLPCCLTGNKLKHMLL